MNEHLHMLESLESAAEKTVSEVLKPLLDVSCWLLGYVPSVVQYTRRETLYIPALVQHMLLRQSMAALRSVVILLVKGYSVPAATIASSLFEMSLYSDYMKDDPAKADAFLKHANSQDFVWAPKLMIRYLAEKRLQAIGKPGDMSELQRIVELINGPYVYLCSLKHSNPIPMRHTVATKVAPTDLTSGVSPFSLVPDTRPEDHIVKAVILAEANQSTFQVTANAANTAETPSKELVEWLGKLVEMQSRHLVAYEQLGRSLGPMPFPTIRR